MAVVLIVDDLEINRELARIVLDQHGHQVVTATDGAAAMDAIHQAMPDVVVTDVLMPGMDGYQLVRALRADPATVNLPVIFYTANYLEEQARPIAAACGVSRVVTKTGDAAPLLEAVDAALNEPTPSGTRLADEDFNREHLQILNSKLIEQLHELEEQNRLRQLVTAAIAVSADLSLPATLQRIVDAARSLLHARYAALGVLAESGQDDYRFISCVYSGLSAEQSAQTVMPPIDRGIRQHDPARFIGPSGIASLRGFAQLHPAVQPVLAVPIVVTDSIFGYLYLSEKNRRDEYIAADENLLVALASAGGTAISNARLYDQARHSQEWLSASAEITSTLLAADPGEALELVARGARRVSGADVAWIEVAAKDQTVVVSASDGRIAHELRGRILPQATLFAEVAATCQPEVLADATTDGRLSASIRFTDITLGPLMVVPLIAAERFLGALLIGNDRGHSEFNPLDLQMATRFAAHAALAIEFATAQADLQRLSLLEERDRIAHNLHERVIMSIYATGLGIQGVAGQLRGPAAQRLTEYVSDIDAVIRQLRDSIYELQAPPHNPAGALHTQLLDVIDSAAAKIGLAPDIRFTGLTDRLIPDEIAADLISVVGEALINMGRHTDANQVGVTVNVNPGMVTLLVSVEGAAISELHDDTLASLRDKALRHDGTFRVTAPTREESLISWSAPLPQSA